MYERHFGLTGSPFQLSPDASFYFDSAQHRGALAALRQAFALAPPFVLLTGEIGSGKTIILRAWLAEVEAAGVVAAQLANTQLDAAELRSAVATAFGIAEPAATSDAAWQGFLRGLGGPAVLLIVDEAQYLDRGALRWLVRLTDMAAAERVALRVCLAGQPELRTRLADTTLVDLQPRIQQSCHLGPLQAPQTRQYIEHRLRKVGWAGSPAFEPAAFEQIQRFTGGVPRRINVLAHRLMLSQFMSRMDRIDACAVIETAQALLAEIGEDDGAGPGRTASEPACVAPLRGGELLLVASGRSDHIKLVPLLQAIRERGDLPAAAVVSVSDGSAWHLNSALHAFIGLRQPPISLIDGSQPTLVEARFSRLVEQSPPAAIIVFDGDPASLYCARAARARDVPLVHVGSDVQSTGEFADPRSTRTAIRRLADFRLECQSVEPGGGSTTDPGPHGVGSLLADAIDLALRMAAQGPLRLEQQASLRDGRDLRRGYGVIAVKEMPDGTCVPCRPEIAAVIRDASRDLPLVWPMRRATMRAMQRGRLAPAFTGDRIEFIAELGHVAFVELLREATCVLTDCADVQEEAAALGVPCLSLGARHASHVDSGGWLHAVDVGSSVTKASRAIWEIIFNGGAAAVPTTAWDGHAGARVAEFLARWLDTPSRSSRALVPRVMELEEPPR